MKNIARHKVFFKFLHGNSDKSCQNRSRTTTKNLIRCGPRPVLTIFIRIAAQEIKLIQLFITIQI